MNRCKKSSMWSAASIVGAPQSPTNSDFPIDSCEMPVWGSGQGFFRKCLLVLLLQTVRVRRIWGGGEGRGGEEGQEIQKIDTK